MSSLARSLPGRRPTREAGLPSSLEAERARWFLWLPVALGGGVACYFRPSDGAGGLVLALALPAMAMAAWAALARQAREARRQLATLLAFVMPGLRARQSAHRSGARAPVLATQDSTRPRYAASSSWSSRRPRGSGVYARASPASRGIDARQTARSGSASALMNVREGLTPGDVIRLTATLAPPSAPALPGGYDFARTAWFLGLGATGYALGATDHRRTRCRGEPLRGRFSRLARATAAAHRPSASAAAIPGEAGAIATLAHHRRARRHHGANQRHLPRFRPRCIFSRSPACTWSSWPALVFASVRILLAAVPAIALRFSTKKWARRSTRCCLGAICSYRDPRSPPCAPSL